MSTRRAPPECGNGPCFACVNFANLNRSQKAIAMSAAKGPSSLRVTPELDALVKLFHPGLQALGTFREATEAELPAIPRKLLWHDHHMTVALEEHHGCELDVQVLKSLVTETHYSRHVLLRCRCSDRVEQYGIGRLNLTFLDETVRNELLSERIPLGRVLINNAVLRQVRLLSLWRIEPSAQLREFLQLNASDVCYGRTALIYCNAVPAVELLEIVSAL